MKTSTVYFRGSDIYILASARDINGIFQNKEPFFQLPATSSALELGQKVLDALATFREGVPGKTYVRGVKQPPDPFLVYSGFKSWGAFERGARYFSVSSDGPEIQIIPGSPAPKGGYLHQPDRAVRIPAQADHVGRALLEQASQIQSG
ncbi:MAG TPA: hypothetical protein VIW67_25730 [Terriglobales bacterium]|jgi:hypothetical protein